MNKHLILAAASSAALLLGAPLAGQGVAFAQAAQATPPNDSLSEVVVVARRAAENLQSVPLTVTAVSAQQLQATTVTTATDLQGLVPSLSIATAIYGPGQEYSLRGIRDGVFQYFNEVPANSILVDTQLWDLSSVQAVAGPQGTLFGRNATGGAVLFVPQRPTADFGGFAQFRYGSYNLRDFTGVLNVPVNDMLKLRFGIETTDRDGTAKNISGNDLGRLDHQNYRLSGVFTPTSWLTDYAVIAMTNRHDTPAAQISKIEGTEASLDGSLPGATYGFYESLAPGLYHNDPEIYYHSLLAQEQRGIRTVDEPIQSVQNNNLYQISNILTAQAGGLTFKSITGYQEQRDHQRFSDLSIPLPIIVGQNDDEGGQLTQEFQVLGKSFNNRLDWVAGVYYSDSWSNSLASYLLFQPVGTPFNSMTTQQTGGPKNDALSMAVYGQGTLSLTDALKLTVGLRYTSDQLDTVSIAYAVGQVCNFAPSPNLNTATCRETINPRSNAITYNVSLDYKVAQGLLVYAATRRGYNAGGINPGFPEGVPNTVQPEYITDYEGGLKADGRIASMPFRVNASAYLSKYSNIQRTIGEVYPINGVDTVITAELNAASATIYGAEVEGTLRPIPDLTLQASYGYLHTKYDSFKSFLGDATGNQFAQAPQHTVHASATYQYPLPKGSMLVANASYSYISSVTFSDINLNAPGSTAPGYGLLDLRLDWKNVGGRGFDVGVYAKNVTNQVYDMLASDNTAQFGFISVQYGDPRTYGIELRYTFGG
jgi:iron complex outermembrane receptor protein